MPLRENALQRSPPKVDRLLVIDDDNSALIDRHRIPVHFLATLFPVDPFGSFDQPRRIDHVARAARVYDRLRVGKVLHQGPGASRMIEMDMGQKYVIDRSIVDALAFERVKQQRNTVVRSSVYKSGVAVLDDDVARIEQRSHVIGVDRRYAVFELGDVGRLLVHEFYSDKGERAMVMTGNIEFQRGAEWPC